MKHVIMTSIIFSTLFMLQPAWAEDAAGTTIQPHWTCMAYDHDLKQWTGESLYEITAANKALDACKKQSPQPTTCKVATEQCSAAQQPVTPGGMWQCTAFDQKATPWVGRKYPQQDAAAIGAKEYCKHHSALPGTCYVNLLTCKDINDED